MGLNSYINTKTLKSYFSDVISKYDTDANGFTQKEFSNAISGMTTIFAKSIIKLTRADKKIFKDLDTNQDSIVSYKEISNYFDKKYELDFYTLINMKVSDVCTAIDEAQKSKPDEE